MNLTLLDRDQLEAILLNPSSEAAQPLVCSDNAVVAYLPVPATARDERLRHVLAAAHELLTRIAAEAIRGRSLIDSPTVMKDFLRVYFAGAERETFVVVFLDASHRVIEVEDRARFLRAGGTRLDYVAALNARPEHVQALSRLVALHTRGWIGAAAARAAGAFPRVVSSS